MIKETDHGHEKKYEAAQLGAEVSSPNPDCHPSGCHQQQPATSSTVLSVTLYGHGKIN